MPPIATTPSPLSFPGSHTADAFAAARLFGAFLPAASFWTFSVIQAGSRPYLGVHYPSDVIAGLLLGIAVAGLIPPDGDPRRYFGASDCA